METFITDGLDGHGPCLVSRMFFCNPHFNIPKKWISDHDLPVCNPVFQSDFTNCPIQILVNSSSFWCYFFRRCYVWQHCYGTSPCFIGKIMKNHHLVGGLNPSEKYEFVSWGYYSWPDGRKKQVPNHQSVQVYYVHLTSHILWKIKTVWNPQPVKSSLMIHKSGP